MCNFIEYKDMKIVYKRYASLYFACITDPSDNELIALEAIHHFVHCLDRYFGNVCELDLVFNFYKVMLNISNSIKKVSVFFEGVQYS